jgi:molybdenum cofactor cytidylyltransferase
VSAPAHAIVLLAAGASRRLGEPKQLVTRDGEPLVRRMARLALTTEPSQAVVVVGHRADDVHATVADLAIGRVDCEDWSEGMGASLRAGIAALRPGIDGALVVLCDQLALTSSHLLALRDTWRVQPQRAVATLADGVAGVPALLPRSWFADVAALHGDRGARDLLRSRGAAVSSIAAPELALDLDEARGSATSVATDRP